MRCSLGRNHTFDLAFAEIIAAPRCTLRNSIAHEGGWRRTRRRDSHPAADQAGAQRRDPIARQLRPSLQYDLEIDAGSATLEAQSFFHGEQDFADPEQAYDGDQKIKAIEQFREAEGQPQLAGDAVE